MYKNNKIAVVVPVYDEEKLIGKVIESMPYYVDKVIVVDDKSKDGSVKVIQSYCDHDPERVILLQNEKNEGCGAALARGYEWAKNKDIDIIIRMDGDGQMDPVDLPALMEPIIAHKAHYVKGNRLFTGESYQKIPKIRYFGNTILSLLTKIASGYWHIADSQSGHTAISKQALQMIDWNKMYKRYGNPNDVLVRLNIYDFKVMDVPIKPIYNVGERSKLNIPVVTFTISWLLIKLFFWRLKEKYIIRDFHPLVFFYLMGVVLLITSAGLLYKAVSLKLAQGYFPPITTLSWMFSFSMGFQFLFFAMWFDMEYHRNSTRS